MTDDVKLAAGDEPEQTISLALTLPELDVVLAHVSRGQYFEVAPVMNRMLEQVNPQLAQQQVAAALAVVPAESEARN